MEEDTGNVVVAGPEPWITLEQAAKHLGVPVSRLYRLRARAEGGRERNPLPFERDGQRLFFQRSQLDAWRERGGADV
jgi:excisionase family DNA binding protein